MTKFIDSF